MPSRASMPNSKRPQGFTCSQPGTLPRGASRLGAVTRDRADAYFDGILWVVLGEKPERLLSILADQIELLTGARPGLETINAAGESRWTITCS